MSKPNQDDTYTEAETEARREATLKKLLSTPPKPHKQIDKKDRQDSKEEPDGPR